jgi:hypothetical protein
MCIPAHIYKVVDLVYKQTIGIITTCDFSIVMAIFNTSKHLKNISLEI